MSIRPTAAGPAMRRAEAARSRIRAVIRHATGITGAMYLKKGWCRCGYDCRDSLSSFAHMAARCWIRSRLGMAVFSFIAQ